MPDYDSACSASIGSEHAARRAGIIIAKKAMPIKIPIAGASDTGFHKLLSVQGAISRFRRAVAAMPAVNPNATVNPNDRNTVTMMLAREAPRAARTANSRVRQE